MISPKDGTKEKDLFSEETELKRDLGLLESFSIVISRIIGSGIFRTPQPIMMAVAAVSLFYGVWILGGIATLLGAFCYAELVAMMPKSGGPYAYLKAAYPPVWTFLRGWAMFFVSETASIVAVALVFAEYSSSLFQLLFGHPIAYPIEILIAFSIIWLLTMLNCFGVFFSGVLQNIFMFIKLLALGTIISFGFVKAGNMMHFSSPLWPEQFGWATMLAVGQAMRYGFFAYSGWEGATYVAEEVKNPRKNLPLSIILGIVGVMLLYLAANSAYLYQLSPEQIKASPEVATNMMNAVVGTAGGMFIALAIALNTFGNVNTQILVKARTWYAMSRDGLFIPVLAKIHPKYRTPNRAMIAQALWATVLLMGAAFAGRAYETIIDFFSFTSSIFNVSTFAAVFILRKKYPNAPRPYRVWGYPFTLIIVLIIQL
ncbi:MAG: amino acid permease, partial [candidate division KSB1 bacterium]|nr:amino acid permease [candidate division KSB1 bacterium]